MEGPFLIIEQAFLLAQKRDTIARLLTSLESAEFMDATAFLLACENNRIAQVRDALPHLDLRRPWPERDHNTPLLAALIAGKSEIAHLLIKGSDLLHANDAGNTPLIMACADNEIDLVKALLPGSAVDHSNRQCNTALMWASYHGNLEMVALLLPFSQISARNNDKRSALDEAVSQRNWKTADLLASWDLQIEQRAWPEKATPEDLPKWHSRLEQMALNDVSCRSVTAQLPVERCRL